GEQGEDRAERARTERQPPGNRAEGGRHEPSRQAASFPVHTRAAYIKTIPIRSGRRGPESRSMTFAPSATATVCCEFRSPPRLRPPAGAFTRTMKFDPEIRWTSGSWEFRLPDTAQDKSRIRSRQQSAWMIATAKSAA